MCSRQRALHPTVVCHIKTILHMRKILTLILITITIASYSQKDEDKLDKREMKKMQKELKKMYDSQSDIELITINPELVNEFIESIKQNDMDKLWDMIDPDVQRILSKEDMIKIFGLYDTYFGRLVDYEQTTFGTQTKGGFGQQATVGYDVNFEKYKGKANGVFKVYDKKTVKMFSFNLSLEDYTRVDTFDEIAKPTVDAIKAKDKKQIYDLTSDRFKEYTSISDFESRIRKILDIDILDYKMFRSQFGIKDGNEVLVIYYELNDKQGYLQLSFTKLNDKFELEGLNYKPNE
jgi:hypothetical protein